MACPVDLIETLDQIFTVAEEKQILDLDLYLSAYVHFWNVDTDECDAMTFGHEYFSQRFPSSSKACERR